MAVAAYRIDEGTDAEKSRGATAARRLKVVAPESDSTQIDAEERSAVHGASGSDWFQRVPKLFCGGGPADLLVARTPGWAPRAIPGLKYPSYGNFLAHACLPTALVDEVFRAYVPTQFEPYTWTTCADYFVRTPTYCFYTVDSLKAEFDAALRDDLDHGLDQLRVRSRLGQVNAHHVASILLPLIARAGSDEMDRLHDAAIALVPPDALLRAGLDGFRSHGQPSWVTAAIAVLGEIGSKAWQALRSQLSAERDESGYFVDLIANCDGVSLADRLEFLSVLAASPHSSVKLRVLDALAEIDGAECQSDVDRVLQRLSGDDDDEVRERAVELLQRLLR